MPKLVFITTVPSALRVLCKGQLEYFRHQGYEVIAVSNPGPDLDYVAARDQIETVGLPMEREIRPWRDLVSLWRMWRLLRRLQPNIVAAATPKAALFGMVAAWLARVPVRVYMQWGLRLETTRGFKRRILWLMERITAACANRVLLVSESLRQEFLRQRLSKSEKTTVLAHGSSNGVDAARFDPARSLRQNAQNLRETLNLPADAPVVGFVGRLVHDKGIIELVDAFEEVTKAEPEARLLLVGDYEAGDPVPADYVDRIGRNPKIIVTGFVAEPEAYYDIMSLLVLPSYREGFPNVVLEASAAALPVVAFRATGSMDAVEEGVTGILVPLGDVQQLAMGILGYLRESEVRLRHGRAGRDRVLHDFQPQTIWDAMHEEFCRLLEPKMKVHERRKRVQHQVQG